MNIKKPLLVYVHIPFCTAKCTFCDWVTEVPPNDLRLDSGTERRRSYIDALVTQIHVIAPQLLADSYKPCILYWGGGTASILVEDEARRVMDALRSHFDLSTVTEATIEASPETLNLDKLEMFREIGFRRISIGLQSLDDRRLHLIGRRHDGEGGAASVAMAKNAGFENVNVDIISGFPGETVQEFTGSLRRVLDLGANHVSLYPYRPAHGTAMRLTMRDGRAGQIDLPEQLEAYRQGGLLLDQAGLHEYALSHFGDPVCESDLTYFQLRSDWVGFGSGATSLLGQAFLRTRPGGLSRFLQSPSSFDERLPASNDSLLARFLYQALSTFEGADGALWQERTGMSLQDTLAQPDVRQFLRRLRRYCDVESDGASFRVPRDVVADAYIRMLFDSAPSTARRGQLLAEAVLGDY